MAVCSIILYNLSTFLLLSLSVHLLVQSVNVTVTVALHQTNITHIITAYIVYRHQPLDIICNAFQLVIHLCSSCTTFFSIYITFISTFFIGRLFVNVSVVPPFNFERFN